MTSDSTVVGNTLVVRDGKIIHEVSNGLADPDAGVALSPRHRFQIASISKQFTAAATLLLADAGKLSVTDRLVTWVEGCPPSWEPITIHHLLSNSSGIGHWSDYPEIDLTAPAPTDALIAAFQTRDPFIEPGSAFRYSSVGFRLLAHIVELAAQRTYHEFLTEEIFTPLGMHDTFAGNGGDRPDLAVGCDPNGKPVDEHFELDAIGRGAGDIWSTARDMVTWNRAVARGALLAAATWRASFEPKFPSGQLVGEDHYYGYGWGVTTIDGNPMRYHTGDNAGFEAFSGWFPELSAHVVILGNRDSQLADMGWQRQRRLILSHLAAAG